MIKNANSLVLVLLVALQIMVMVRLTQQKSTHVSDGSAGNGENQLRASLEYFRSAEDYHFHNGPVTVQSGISLRSRKLQAMPLRKESSQKHEHNATLFDIIKMREGKGPNPWKVVNWADTFSTDDQPIFNCEWTTFISTSGKHMGICDGTDKYTRSSCPEGEHLAKMWHQGKDKVSSYFMEIGSQRGACILDMLLDTDARIIAFEGHPKNVYSITKTISALPQALQDRVVLFPISLADASMQKQIGHHSKSESQQEFKLSIYAERLDSILDMDRIKQTSKIRLVNLNVQGYDCKILEGIGKYMAGKVDAMKLKRESFYQKCGGSKNYIAKLRNELGFDVLISSL